ncbi:hypothetical protein VTN49DRAFT_3834 [Thermomyces lanuginosus]|uniref:uncharacterized protein n=1 Tax=Thermomyces lanuginosus TaxID=5541 RepID=UPI003742E269
MASQEPLKILSLDGGGIRGLSSLLILEDIMEKIRDKNGHDSVPRPCEYFDLIGGTGTGGIIAIMLGRLQMTVDECIKAYRELAKSAFSLKSRSKSPSRFKERMAFKLTSRSNLDVPSSSSPAFSAMTLENAMKSIIRSFCADPECKNRRDQGHSTAGTCPHEDMLFRDKTCTKTVVLATTRDNFEALPTLFTTYDVSTAFETCTIWQVARATSAAVGFFESIKLGRDEIEFVDAAFGHNNPCEVLIREAQKQFPERHQMRILSIGTGLGDVITIKDSPASIISALRNMVTSSKMVAQRLHDRFDDESQYFRFNVDQGLKDITLSDWEKASTVSAHTRNYLAENERAIRRFVDNLFARAAAGVSELEPHKRHTHFAVPFERNPNFVGRESIMEQLLATIPPSVNGDCCQKTALVGLGGVGKTQIALEIGFRIREKYPDCSVFWVPAIDAVNFRNAYRNIGQLLGIDSIDDDKADVEELVKTALSRETAGSWLLIIDNADSPDLFEGRTNLSRHLPFSRKGSLLFTSRNRELTLELGVPTINVFDIEGMSETEGFRLLETHLTKSQMSNREDTAKLLDFLGYLPLAIRQASAYMAKKQISTTRYLELCQSSEKYKIELLSRDFEDSHRYKETKNPIATTWLISFRQIEDHDPLAADYLKFMCFLSEKAIPRSLLPGDAWSLEAEDAIGTLKAYVFITEGEAPDKYDIHRLVRIAMLNWLDKQGEIEEWTTKVIRHVEESFPFPWYENKVEWIGYLSHAQQILQRATAAEENIVSLLFKVGRGFDLLAQYHEAERMYRQAIAGQETVLGPDHPDTLISVNSLGNALQGQNRYEEAEVMHRRALEAQEKVLGLDHPDTLTSVHCMGNVLRNQKQYEKAEAMHRRALEGRERVLGPDDPNTLGSINSLGNTLSGRGQYKEAEAIYRQALDRQKKVLGPNHPDTFYSMNNLGTVLEKQGQYEEAKAMYRQALEGLETVLGPDHFVTLGCVANLGGILRSQGQYEEAEKMHRRELEGREKLLGPDHPDTLTSANNLGVILHHQGKHKEAEAMYRQSQEGREEVLGPDHPDTLISTTNLGLVLEDLGRYEEAEKLFRRALERREKSLGPDRPDTVITASYLGIILKSQGRYKEAEEMFRQVLEGQEKVLGPDHPDTLSSAYNLGSVLYSQGQYEEAELMFRRVLDGRERVLGPDHPDTLTGVSDLGNVLKSRGRYKEAEMTYRRALEGRERVLGPNHPDTLVGVADLGIVLKSQGRYKEAEAMYRRALEGQEMVLGPLHPETLNSANDLGGIHFSQRNYEEAEAMILRALEGREKVLGPDHPDTLASVFNMAIVLERRGQYEHAEAMYRRAADGQEKTLGRNRPDTVKALDNLARILKTTGSTK